MIVGICGLAGSGKDTTADFLVADHGFQKVSFADPMKRFCREIFDFTDKQCWGPSEYRNAPDSRYPRGLRRYEFPDAPPGALNADIFLTPRFALQQLGTQWGRNCYESIWVDYAIRVAKKLDGKEGISYDRGIGIFKSVTPKNAGVVIPDCRFANEIDAVHRAGGKVVRIFRPGAGLAGAAGLHASEKEQAELPDDLFDVVLENVGSLERLRGQVESLAILLSK